MKGLMGNNLPNVGRKDANSLRKLAHAINRFLALKLKILADCFLYFPYFCSKHRLLVHVTTASAHNLCFGAKIRKKGMPLHLVLPYKSGVLRVYITRTCFRGVFFCFMLLFIFSLIDIQLLIVNP